MRCHIGDAAAPRSVIVIGGGPAGSVCARELARLGHTVVLLERSLTTGPRLGETCGPGLGRVLAGSCGLAIPPSLFSPLRSFFSARGAEEHDGRSFAFWHAGEGLVLDRRAFDEWLLEAAAAAGVAVVRGCNVVGSSRDRESWLVRGLVRGHERVFPAGFIVEATGRVARSVVQPDVRRFFTDHLVCLALELPGKSPDNSFAMVESCADGWWYAVRLPNGAQIVALFTDADLAPKENRPEFLNSVLKTTRHVRALAGRIPDEATVRIWNARTSARNVLWRGCWVSIGDSAWCLDPLSGAGIERAVNEGVLAAAAISDAIIRADFAQLRSFAISQGHAFRRSLTLQRQYYASETRWKDAVFWRRRF